MDTDLRGLDRNTPYQRIALCQCFVPRHKGDVSYSIARSSTPKIRVNLRSSAVGLLLAFFAILPERHSLGDVCCGYLISAVFFAFCAFRLRQAFGATGFRGYSVFQ
jgi:hypothetical protein